ncbi:MAG: hypothetical protein LBT05_12800 [Planctomycetaceae bacterium]|jgi:hypothetical protein|nr:hypothetical protein [Planctomycetaceae bacterium]
MLDREEYVEQQFFFQTFRERVETGVPAQESLVVLRAEVLASTKLPMAIDFMLADVKHAGIISPSMFRLKHYFTKFQAYVIQKSEIPDGKFDFRIALRILENEAKFRISDMFTCAGLFFYQFETLCRNKLGYQEGLAAIADDSIYNQHWKEWILSLHHELGVIDFAEMIFLRSEYCSKTDRQPSDVVLFSEREGRIARATLGRDPVYLFSALSRHLNYPEVPRQKPINAEENLIPLLQRRIEHLENRLLLFEEELRGGVNLNRFYVKGD